MKTRRATVAVACLATVMLVISGCGGSTTTPDDALVPSSVVRSALSQTAQILTSLETRSGADDPRYFSDDTWVDGSPTCLRCTLGPALLAAVQARVSDDAHARELAVESLSNAVRTYQQPDGSFVSPESAQSGKDINTVFLANSLAATYLVLGDRVPASDRELWKESLTRSADFLIQNGDLSYYVNGNINLAVSENMDLVSRITGESRFAKARRASLAFTLDPPAGKWQDYGLHYTRRPTRSDYSDGSAYLAESGGGAPGYDPFYTTMQLSIAAQWLVLTGSKTAKRLTNLLFNQQRPRIRSSDWTIDLTGGTRDSAHGDRYDFTSSGLAALALRGGRTDLLKYLPSNLGVTFAMFRTATTLVNPGYSYAFSLDLAPTVLAVALGKD